MASTYKRYRVDAYGFFGRERHLMSVEVDAKNASHAKQYANRMKMDYFGRFDYEAGTLRWTATRIDE